MRVDDVLQLLLLLLQLGLVITQRAHAVFDGSGFAQLGAVPLARAEVLRTC